MISSIANLVNELHHELPNGGAFVPTQEKKKTYDLRKSGNIRKTLNLGGDIAQRPVPAPEIKPWQQQSKKMQK